MQTDPTPKNTWPRGHLLGALLVIGLVWCMFLPWLANRPSVAERLKWLDEKRIDPSAMFYTELDAMDGILDRREIP